MAAEHGAGSWAQDVGDEVRSFAPSLTLPLRGANAGFEAVRWLVKEAEAAGPAVSLVMPSLRQGEACFGLPVRASPDQGPQAAAQGAERAAGGGAGRAPGRGRTGPDRARWPPRWPP